MGGGRAERTVAIVESVSNALGFVSFKETGSQMGEAGMREVHTLSLGGKVMVVDVEVEAESGRVLKVKFSYVLESQHDDDEVAQVLGATLRGVENVLDVEEEEGVENRLRRFRAILTELKRVDEITAETSVDCFAATAKMAKALAEVLDPERFVSLRRQSGVGCG